jgi:hypothetical protein
MPRIKPRFEERLVELNPWRSATSGFVTTFDQRPRCFLIGCDETGPTPAALRPKRRRHALRRLWPSGARLRRQSGVEIDANIAE